MSPVEQSVAGLLDAARGGNQAAMGRLITLIERGGAPGRAVSRASFPGSGAGYTVGLTGPPGAGKSTLVSRLIEAVRAQDQAVAVLAVDPSSPFSGGAILGDRVRMDEHASDPAVFIRSMASRGELGGLARAVPEALRLLDAVGFPWLLLETVGVGQIELDVARAADSVIVVLTPGAGDDVQTVKAGVMEIADIFVINKADRDGADDVRRSIRNMLRGGAQRQPGWTPPVLSTVASEGIGTDALLAAIASHQAWLTESGKLEEARATRLWQEVDSILVAAAQRRARDRCLQPDALRLRERVADRHVDPASAADLLLGDDGRHELTSRGSAA